MAQIFPEELGNFNNLSSASKAVYRLFEQNLSDEWECHAAFSGNNVVRFIITSPDLGVLVLCISDCSSDQFDSFFNDIPQIKQQNIDAVKQQLQKENQLCNQNKDLKFPVGFGMIFTELSRDYLNSTILGTLSRCALFSDELRDMIDSQTDLENRLFGMIEEIDDFYELDNVALQLISNNIALIQNDLQDKDIEGNIKQSDNDKPGGVAKNDHDLDLWWNSLDEVWKEIILKNNEVHKVYFPNQIRRMLELTEIELKDVTVTDLDPLRNFESLEKLIFNGISGSNLPPLNDMKRLKDLSIFNVSINDLTPLRNLKSLEGLSINDAPVSNLDPLKNLKNLKKLFIRNTSVRELGPLQNLQSIETLAILGSPVSDLSPLENMNSLKYLIIVRTSINDLNPLKNLKSLEALVVSDSPVSDLSPLKNLKSLEYLKIENTQINDLDPLKNLISLKDISITNSPISDFEPLKELKGLEKIDLPHLGITDINSFRKKYPFTDKNPGHQPEEVDEDGGHGMNENRGIEPFINHLEFLGFECKESDTELGLKLYLFTHQLKPFIALIPIDQLDTLIVMYQMSYEESKIANKKYELLKTINEVNESSINTWCYITEENTVVVKAVPSIRYSKIDFGIFIDMFQKKVEEINNVVTEILEREQEKSVTAEDDIPF